MFIIALDETEKTRRVRFVTRGPSITMINPNFLNGKNIIYLSIYIYIRKIKFVKMTMTCRTSDTMSNLTISSGDKPVE